MREVTKKLKKELAEVEHEFRVELPREIGAAVAQGDLSENAEYHAALERQSFLKAKISHLRERLSALASISMDNISTTSAGIGSTVKLLDLDTDEEITYKLVFPELANLEKGMISIASPVARSIIGKTEGDEFETVIPSGTKHYEVLELITMHDAKQTAED